MLRIGILGFGFMGRMHYRCWGQCEGAKVVAVCDANRDMLSNASKGGGNIEGAEGEINFSELNVYTDFAEMLKRENLDAVSITLPTFLHPEFTVQALNTGVHVLCEKPMALQVELCEQMIEAANRNDRVLQIGHCIRFWPEYVYARQVVQSGEYGKVIAAVFRRMGAAPTWSKDNWFADEKRSGGMILDLHIHDTDYVQYLFGRPESVYSRAGRVANDKGNGVAAHVMTSYNYGDGLLVSAEGSWAVMPSFGFEMSFNIVLERATIVYDCTRSPALRVCPAQGDAFEPDVDSTVDGYVREIDYFARRVRGEHLPEVITLGQSRDAVRIVEAEKQSLNSGDVVGIDW